MTICRISLCFLAVTSISAYIKLTCGAQVLSAQRAAATMSPFSTAVQRTCAPKVSTGLFFTLNVSFLKYWAATSSDSRWTSRSRFFGSARSSSHVWACSLLVMSGGRVISEVSVMWGSNMTLWRSGKSEGIFVAMRSERMC